MLRATVLTPTRLKAVTGLNEAVDLFRELGFGGSPVSVHADELGLGDLPDNRVLKSASGSSKGSAVFFAETTNRPRSFKTFGKGLLENLHDQPLPSSASVTGTAVPGPGSLSLDRPGFEG